MKKKLFIISSLLLAFLGSAYANDVFLEDRSTPRKYIHLKAPSTIAATLSFTMPPVDGTAGQCLLTNGAGVLSFGAASISSSNISDGTIVNADVNSSAAIDASKIADGTVSSSEFQFINSLTSNAQTQISSKVTQNAWSTYSPTVTLAGAGNVPVYVTNSGQYLTVGKIVFVTIYLAGDGGTDGSGSTQLRIALPVTASANNTAGYVSMGAGADAAFPGTGNFHILGRIGGSSTYVELALFSGATTTAYMTGGDQTSASRYIRLNFFYQID